MHSQASNTASFNTEQLEVRQLCLRLQHSSAMCVRSINAEIYFCVARCT
jgi:hypothetical protein